MTVLLFLFGQKEMSFTHIQSGKNKQKFLAYTGIK